MSEVPAKPVESQLVVEKAPSRMRFLYIYSFVFENPNWLMNLLYGFLCFLSGQVVPVIGHLVFVGYLFDVTESLVRHPNRVYPDFEPNKFGHYLQRSLPPFLITLIFTLPIMLVAGGVCAVEALGLFAAAAVAGPDAAPFVAVGGVLLVSMTFVGIVTLGFVPVTPFYLRAGLAQDLGQGLKFGWAMDFLKRTWLESLLFCLFNVVTMIPMMILGYSCCFIGMFAVLALDGLAGASTNQQLYNLYLARGGEPIPLKEPPA